MPWLLPIKDNVIRCVLIGAELRIGNCCVELELGLIRVECQLACLCYLIIGLRSVYIILVGPSGMVIVSSNGVFFVNLAKICQCSVVL